MKKIDFYFPEISPWQKDKIEALLPLYQDWNSKINVLSRKETLEQWYERHILHSLSIAFIKRFEPNAKVLDLGTGGGFPGIPLAIMFPKTKFLLVDSIGKKIKVAKAVAETLELENISFENARAESLKGSFDTVVSRAVAPLKSLYLWTKHLSKEIICLKGGDLTQEIEEFRAAVSVAVPAASPRHSRLDAVQTASQSCRSVASPHASKQPQIELFDIRNFIAEEFFESKKILKLNVD